MTDERRIADEQPEQDLAPGDAADRAEDESGDERALVRRILAAEQTKQDAAREAAERAAAPATSVSTAGLDRALERQAAAAAQMEMTAAEALAALRADFHGQREATGPALAELERLRADPGAQRLQTLDHLAWWRRAQAYQRTQIPEQAESTVAAIRTVKLLVWGQSHGEDALPSAAEQLTRCQQRLLRLRAADMAALPHDFRANLREEWRASLDLPRAAAEALRTALVGLAWVEDAIATHEAAGKPVATIHDGARAAWPEAPAPQRVAGSRTARPPGV